MSQYILKRKAIDAVYAGIKLYHDEHHPLMTVYDYIFDAIGEIEAEDVTPVVHGEFIESDYGSYICSVCGEDWVLNDGTPKENNMRHCPRCGARMDGEEE